MKDLSGEFSDESSIGKISTYLNHLTRFKKSLGRVYLILMWSIKVARFSLINEYFGMFITKHL
jgi:hypothetical protein